MEKIYRNVCERLRTNVQGLESVVLDCGQIDEPGSELALPAALVEVSYPECTDITRFTQRYRIEVSVRVAATQDARFSKTHHTTSDLASV